MLVKYATVKIPQPLADKIVEIAVQKLGTYRTVSEFVIESARHHLESIKPSE
jgi:Arc/MetJ-type ribon-helix-helix transcriptional regulator